MNEVYANIIVDITTEALNKSFVFKVPKDMYGKLKPGDKVTFPFGKGNKEKEGFLLELLNEEQLKNKKFYKNDNYFKQENALEKLKEITGLANNKIGINSVLLKIAIFLCKEYYCPISLCLNAVMPVKKIIRKNSKQVDAIKNYDVNEEEKNIKNNILLNDYQKQIVDSIVKEHSKGEYSEHLIYGVTGSGKTEVYIKVIEKVLSEGKQVIVMIPEIALTHQTVIRLKEKFSDTIAIIHSRMSNGDKYIQYKKCEDGMANVLVGPRSAIFSPFINLGLVVIDEVNDSSYKSENNPRYDTLEVARYRCKEQNATLMALSATPNIPYYYEAKNKLKEKLFLHELPKRASSSLPSVILVDMREEFKKGNKSIFSNLLIEKINDRLEKKEQVMLYINRRGYDTILTCKECGETIKCEHCDVAYVSHNDGKLRCHYCGAEINEPFLCPNCKSKNIEKYGIGTEKLEEMCIELFPNARVLRMDRDTTKEKGGHDKIIEKFKNHKADILIGTQMIVKGHDFPLVTLVGVMNADLSLYAQNYKSSENTFAMLTQCVGRSGRAKKGESIIQCYDINNFAIKSTVLQDYKKFYEEEIKFREKLMYPPFGKMLQIKLSSENVDWINDFSKNLVLFLTTKNDKSAIILGPTSDNPSKIKDIYYMRITLKCNTNEDAKYFRRLSQNFLDYKDKQNLIKIVYDVE